MGTAGKILAVFPSARMDAGGFPVPVTFKRGSLQDRGGGLREVFQRIGG